MAFPTKYYYVLANHELNKPLICRSTVVDFTAVVEEGIITLISASGHGVSMQFWAYLEVFPLASWGLIACLMSLSALAILFALRFQRRRPIVEDVFASVNSATLFLLQLSPDVATYSVSSRNFSGLMKCMFLTIKMLAI